MSAKSNEAQDDTERINLTLESRPESADRAQALITQVAEKVGYDTQQCHDIGLAVRESVANAVLHGNRSDLNKNVFVTAEMRAPGLAICVRDEGEGFDPASLPDPLVSTNLLRESGRGLFLVKALMDEVILRRAASTGMEITMTKYLVKRA